MVWIEVHSHWAVHPALSLALQNSRGTIISFRLFFFEHTLLFMHRCIIAADITFGGGDQNMHVSYACAMVYWLVRKRGVEPFSHHPCTTADVYSSWCKLGGLKCFQISFLYETCCLLASCRRGTALWHYMRSEVIWPGCSVILLFVVIMLQPRYNHLSVVGMDCSSFIQSAFFSYIFFLQRYFFLFHRPTFQ